MPSLRTVEIPFELIEGARNGEHSAQEQIYRSLARPVYTLLRRLVGRPAIAEELLQDVFVEMLRSLPGFQASGGFVGWVRSIALSKALMYLRSPWHRRLTWLDSQDETWAGRGVTDQAPFDSDLARALARLSPVRVQARVQQRPYSARSVAWQYAGLAAAVIVVAGGLLWQGTSWRPLPPTRIVPASDGGGGAAQASIPELVQRSQQLEAILQALPSRPVVERAGTSATIDELQSSIQLVDLRLTDLMRGELDSADQRRLWNTRVALLDSLVNVRYAEAASAGGLRAIDTGVI